MAGRTSASFGVGATITILALAALGFFVAFAVFYGKYSGALQRLQQAQNDQADIVRPDERNRDDVRNLVEEARQAGGKSLVGFLVDAQEATASAVTGASRDRPSDLLKKVSEAKGNGETGAILAILAARRTEIESLRTQVQQADAARQAAIANQQAEVDRVAGIEESHKRTVDNLTVLVNQYRDMIEEYRKGTDGYKKNVDAELDKVKTAGSETERRLQDQLQRMTEEKLILENQLASLRGQRNAGLVRPNDEYALVDGEIVALDGGNKQVFISLGKKNKVVLGMTFSVYTSGAALRPDEEGNYPRGKATLEVVNVGDTTSACRIVSEVRGNPVVKGDVIANAVYDPNKVYKFVVYGNFDTDRDGLGTELEQAEVRSMVEAWGGTIVPELAGDADFLILGERPMMPVRPGSDAPLVVVLEFQARTKDVQKYDELQRQALATSVPILTENRLYTLIGKTPSPARR